ncbi:hypothetical protein RvY_04641 [Ramazzottius varieornatus]|uniref:Uncharacterized protein n=1 Tax=Ramazzottius varieornatus TaxID=947166 RepID=A0A1D1V291_RAMVA|nr:hypothetical protein RvY_04641 [Ramazzottius varieornatus]
MAQSGVDGLSKRRKLMEEDRKLFCVLPFSIQEVLRCVFELLEPGGRPARSPATTANATLSFAVSILSCLEHIM